MRALILVLLFVSGVQASTSLPADITLLVVDLKYNEKQGVKICEIQPAIISGFRGLDFAYSETGRMASSIDALLSRYCKKLWFKAGEVFDPEGPATFRQLGWRVFRTLEELHNSSSFQSKAVKEPHDKYSLGDYAGAVYMRWDSLPSLGNFRKQNPGIIVVGGATFSRNWDKLTAAELFDLHPSLQELRPQWASYAKGSSPALVRKILADIRSPQLVIKPLKGTKGHGIIITPRANLAKVLDRLFRDNQALSEDPDPDYNWWSKDKTPQFLVEEFIASTPVYPLHLGGASYDGTMRVTFALIYDDKKYSVEFLGSYWKLPEASLDDTASLNGKHKSCGELPYFAPVDRAVRKAVQAELEKRLPHLHKLLLVG